jgi:hypothetical protein
MNENVHEPSEPSTTRVRGLAAGRREADCFADEVVIDFPSMDRAVERVRRSFMEPDAAITTAVRLTPREAVDGAVVPVEAPVRCVCRGCGGRGETSWTETCARCAGSGSELRRHRVQVALPAHLPNGSRFHFTVTPRHEVPTRVELCVVVG